LYFRTALLLVLAAPHRSGGTSLRKKADNSEAATFIFRSRFIRPPTTEPVGSRLVKAARSLEEIVHHIGTDHLVGWA
jgi:hypothetical protein